MKRFSTLILIGLFIASFTYAQEGLRGKLGIGGRVGGNYLYNDEYHEEGGADYSLGPVFGLNVKYGIIPGLSAEASFDYTWSTYTDEADKEWKNIYMPIAVNATYDFSQFIPEDLPLAPFVTAGLGAYIWDFQYDGETIKHDDEELSSTSFGFNGGVGLEYFPMEELGVLFSARGHYVMNEDEEKWAKDFTDYLIDFGAGVIYYFPIGEVGGFGF